MFFFSAVRYKKDQEIAFLATCSLHNMLNVSLLSESGPPMLDFEVVNTVMFFVKVPGMLSFFIVLLVLKSDLHVTFKYDMDIHALFITIVYFSLLLLRLSTYLKLHNLIYTCISLWSWKISCNWFFAKCFLLFY